MPKIAQYCFFILAFLLPIQTILAQLTTNILGLPEWLNFWKEILCIVIMTVLLLDLVNKRFWKFNSLRGGKKEVFDETDLGTEYSPTNNIPTNDRLFYKGVTEENGKLKTPERLAKKMVDYLARKKEFILATLPLILIILITIFSFLSSFVFNKSVLKVFFYGFRFEVWWLWFFAVIATWWNISKLGFQNNSPTYKNPLYPEVTKEITKLNTPLSLRCGKNEVFEGVQHANLTNIKHFYKYLTISIFLGFSFVAVISSSTLIFGQNKILKPLGFGNTKQGLVTTAPICQVIDFGSEDCRLSGTFSTPNHFSGYLILILPIFIITLSYKTKACIKTKKTLHENILISFLSISIFLILIFIYTSYSRFALLGLLAWFLFWFVSKFSKKFIGKKITILTQSLTILIPLFIGIIGINLPVEVTQKLPLGLGKPSSTIEHQRHTGASLDILKESPKILVTGLGLGSSGPAAKSEYQNLATENNLYKNFSYISFRWYIIPERITIPENWYLQLILNGGIIYLILNMTLILYVFKNHLNKNTNKNLHISLAFFTIILGNLLLHLWENQTIALYWTIIWIWYEASSV